MKKPVYGDELTIQYRGATVMARCDGVIETPQDGPGKAKFTIVSKTPFHNGGEAFLKKGPNEISVRVDRVMNMSHKGISIVSFTGIFDEPAVARSQAV